jgi:hypothetical protein
MVFAEIQHLEHYSDFHGELRDFIGKHFSNVQSGIQSDSWIWILDGEEKVAIDTFTSMKHQVKSPKPGPHVQKVIEALLLRFDLRVYEKPEFEGHEDAS